MSGAELALSFQKRIKANICEEDNRSEYLNHSHYNHFQITQGFLAISSICFFVSMTLCICLLKLIAIQMKYPDGWHRIKNNAYKWLLSSIAPSIFCVIITAIPYTNLLLRPVTLIISFFYLIQFYLNARRLKQALTQYAYQRLVQYNTYRKELNQLKVFTIKSGLLTLVIFMIICTLTLEEIQFETVSILFFAKCYLPLIYNSTTYTPLLHDPNQLRTLFKVNHYLAMIDMASYSSIILLFLLLLSAVTLQHAILSIKKHFQKVKTRYNYGDLEKLIKRTTY